MASSSASSVHEVFISFRGEDTRNKFTSHLHAALKRKKIATFVDYKLDRGEVISEALLRAIVQSKISIVVLSENYASSSWCLDELCKILECKEKNRQTVVPIFYHVDPSHVRNQTGSFANAFAKHQERFKDGTDKVDRWRASLFIVSGLAGYHLDAKQDRPEADLVEDIAKYIWKKLERELSTDVQDLVRGLVGMDSRIEKLEELLSDMESDGVRIIGIWGMPGVGKTTTAEVLFKRISGQFEASYFLANIREKSMSQARERARNELLSNILDINVTIGTPRIRGSYIAVGLRRRKVLIVLDDVNNSQHVEYFIDDGSCFGPGSIIIITSRDKKVLKVAKKIHMVEKLTREQACHLLTQFACGQNRPIPMERLVRYADGIPLALQIWGRILSNEEEGVWLRRLEKGLTKEIHEVLRTSYDGLEENEQRIFLDVACFFKGDDKIQVTDILDGCGFYADIGISVLISKSLITTVNNNLQMNNLIQEMGRQIVREQSQHPGERNRLWTYNDINNILTAKKGTKTAKTVEGIFLNMSEIKEPMYINPEAFLKMYNLRLLKIYNPHSQEDFKIHLLAISYGLDELPTDLVYLHWHCFPLKSLPPTYNPKNLVELHMRNSHVTRLWKGTLTLKKLKWIDLSYSQNLMEIPDLSEAPNLVRINLVGCTSLFEIPSTTAPLNYLQVIYLSGCSNLKNFPLLSWNVEELHLDGTAIEEVPAEIQRFSRLTKLNMKNCQRLKKLPRIHQLKSLEYLVLSGCSNLANFAENQHVEIWAKTKLSIQQRFQSVLELPPNLQHLDAHDCTLLQAESSSFPICRGWGQKFIFTNCIKLDQNTIWAKTQLSIQQRATADVKLYHKDKKQDLKPRFSSICICFPGSEIPEWFNSKNLGSSVTILLPLHLLHGHKLVGFVLCAIVAFEECDKDLGFTVKCRCNFKTKGDDCGDCLSSWSVWDKSDSPRFIGSDHVFLGYDFILYSHWYCGESKYQLNEASFEFSACDSDSGSPLDSCIFKMCGVSLLHTQDDLNEIEIVGGSESKSDAKECNHLMIQPCSPYNPHFLSDGISAKRPRFNYYDDEAEPSALMRKTSH